MRPSVQLPSVSGVDSKLGLTMVRHCSRRLSHQRLICRPQVNMDAVACGKFLRFLTSYDLDLWPFNWKLALHLLVSWGTFIPFFSTFFVLELRARTWQTDRQTDGRTRCVKRPIGRPYKNQNISNVETISYNTLVFKVENILPYKSGCLHKTI